MQELAPERDRASMQQHPGGRGTKLMPYMARVEYHDRHALSVEFGLAGDELVHADLGDRGALGVGPITRDQLLQRIAHVLRQQLVPASRSARGEQCGVLPRTSSRCASGRSAPERRACSRMAPGSCAACRQPGTVAPPSRCGPRSRPRPTSRHGGRTGWPYTRARSTPERCEGGGRFVGRVMATSLRNSL